jgi:hypothetical protein
VFVQKQVHLNTSTAQWFRQLSFPLTATGSSRICTGFPIIPLNEGTVKHLVFIIEHIWMDTKAIFLFCKRSFSACQRFFTALGGAANGGKTA